MPAAEPSLSLVATLPTLESLEAFVHEHLCRLDQLDRGQTPLKQTFLRRGGRTCGIVFHAEGPRLLRTSAVWAANEARILFYDSTGRRAHEVRLSESPELGSAEKRPVQRKIALA